VYQPLPPRVAEKLGQLLHAGLFGNTDVVALSEGVEAVRVKRSELDWALDMARKCAALDEVKLSAPVTAPVPKPQQTVRLVNGATEAQRRAAEILAFEKVRDFESRYGRGATIKEAQEQEAAHDYLARMGL
jgi:hypothetical protein